MKKLRTILTIGGLFLVPAIAGAQTNLSSTKEVKERKDAEVKTAPVGEQEVIERRANMTRLTTQEPAARKVDLVAIDKSIEEIETKIKENQDNPNFNTEAYEKRLKFLRDRKEEATK